MVYLIRRQAYALRRAERQVHDLRLTQTKQQLDVAQAIDLVGVSYLDSHAIAGLVELSKRLTTNRRRLFLVAQKVDAVGKILATTNLELAIPICDSLEDALLRLHPS